MSRDIIMCVIRNFLLFELLLTETSALSALILASASSLGWEMEYKNWMKSITLILWMCHNYYRKCYKCLTIDYLLNQKQHCFFIVYTGSDERA